MTRMQGALSWLVACIISLEKRISESQLGMKSTAVGRRRPSRIRQTYVNYGRTNGRKPTWQHAAIRLIRRSAGRKRGCFQLEVRPPRVRPRDMAPFRCMSMIPCQRNAYGSEICQQYLVKAPAKHFGARLLAVDSSMLLSGQTSKESEPYKKGDRVRFIGSLLLASIILDGNRPPEIGSPGEICLPFEENRLSKVGVRFDEQIPGGIDL